MAKKLLKRWLPNPATFKEHKSLQFMEHLLHDPNLFHLNRHSVSGAVFIGLFIAFLPIPGQMPLAALLALYFRVNLPIAVALVWVTNPLTMPFIFFATYELGRLILGTPPVTFSLDISWEWLTTEFFALWKPLLLGCVISGIVSGGAGYFLMQFFWRRNVLRNWDKRKILRPSREAKED